MNVAKSGYLNVAISILYRDCIAESRFPTYQEYEKSPGDIQENKDHRR